MVIQRRKSRRSSADDYIRSTNPVLWISGRRDGAIFTSDDAFGRTCTKTGVLWTPQGYDFDGVDDNILVDDSLSRLDLVTVLSYRCWVKPTDGGDTYGRFMAKTSADPYTTRQVMLGKEADDETNVRWEAGSVGALNSGAGAMTVDAWNHVVGTAQQVGANTVRNIYVNGVLKATHTGAGTITSTAGGVLWLGALFTTNQNYKGMIGEVVVYNRVLTLPEVIHDFNATRARYGV